jgi:molecular chaperone GrpE
MPLPKKEQRVPIRRPGDQTTPDGDAVPQSGMPSGAPDLPRAEAASRSASVDEVESQAQGSTEGGVDWRDAALRLKAEMENYRKRQKRWAEDEILREKADLLFKFLEVVDNLEIALEHIDPQDPTHQGVRLAYDALLNMLLREGVERIFAKNQVFDPNYHEAVAVVPAPRGRGDELRIVEVTSSGYRYNDRVLRPAKVVVAKPGV